MKKVGLTQDHRTEKAIIDALLKISEIVQKTEAGRQRHKSTNTNKYSNRTVGDGDYNELCGDEAQQQVPVPPIMRTLDSYVSGFNQQSIQRPSNCNQAAMHRSKQCISTSSWNPQENNKQEHQSLEKHRSNSNDYKDEEHSYKRLYDDTSSVSSSSDNYHRKKSLKHHASQKSFQSNQTSQPMYHQLKTTDNQPTITTCNSQTTFNQIKSTDSTIADDPSSSLVMMPVTSVPISEIEQEESKLSSSTNTLTDAKADFNLFIDQQLQATLKKRLRNHSLPSTITNHENSQQQWKTKAATLTKSEIGKLMNELGLTKQVCNSEHYEKQRELAMLAAKQGNYSLSYSIYTNLLHDSQYDYKLKSEILASRATTLLLEDKCFESIDDCTQAIAFNQWNKLAYVIRAACWMIKQEYSKAVDDYSKLFHFFDQSQHVLDLLNLAYEKLKTVKTDIDDEQSIKIEQEKENNQSIKNIKNENNITQHLTSSVGTCVNPTQSLSLSSPTASFIQPAVYLCYPYQAYPTWCSTNNEQQPTNERDFQQPTCMITNAHPSRIADQSFISSEQHHYETKYKSSPSIHSNNNNALLSAIDPVPPIEYQSSYINKNIQSNLIWIKNPYRSF